MADLRKTRSLGASIQTLAVTVYDPKKELRLAQLAPCCSSSSCCCGGGGKK